MRRLPTLIFAAALAAALAPTAGVTRLHAQGDANQLVPTGAYQGLRWRNVGAGRGGRITGLAGVRQQPHTFYIGATGGGVWKTDDAGINWYPVGDGQLTTGSIGSIDVAPSSPNHVYVGTGSAAIRSNVIIGRGVFKSTDAGKSFQFAGLRESGQIGAIRVHPTNPDIVWAAALGSPFGPTADRGIYKTIDGGTSWKKTLFIDHEHGGRDIEVDWQNPSVLYAAIYKGFRKGWDIVSGGPADKGGIYKSTDGGETWQKLSAGLPADAHRQDRSRHRPQQSERALRDGRGARQRGRPLSLERRRRELDDGERQPAPARAAVLLPLRERQPQERERGVGERARPAPLDRRRQDLHHRQHARTATTTACGSTPTIPTSSCR